MRVPPGAALTKFMTGVLPFEIFEMEHSFEVLKVSMGYGTPEDELIDLRLPELIREKIDSGELKFTATDNEEFIVRKNKFLKFRSEYIRNVLFQVTCQRAFAVIEKVLESNVDIKTVILVGGFSESKIVQNDIQRRTLEKFKNVEVVVPTSPFQAVLNGAVLFGHDPFIIRSRIMKKTYGVSTNSIFDPNKHDENKKWKNEETGRYYCKDLLSIHVLKGDSVTLLEEQPSLKYYPLYKNQKRLSLILFEYSERPPSKDTVIYTTDEKCSNIGKIVVNFENNNDGTSRAVSVKMIYGGTQLNVIATDEKTKVEEEAVIDFSIPKSNLEL